MIRLRERNERGARQMLLVLAAAVTTVVFALLIGRLLKAREEMPDGQALYD